MQGDQDGREVAYGRQTDLESRWGTTLELARAVAVALDLDLGQLGDCHDRDDGVKGDAKKMIKNWNDWNKKVTYSVDMLISGASKQISSTRPMFDLCVSCDLIWI